MTPTETALAETFEATSASFGGRLQAAREAKGLTVQGLSEKLGVQPESIEAWESDEDSPRSNRLQMLAGLLNVSIVWLINGESNGTSHVEDAFDRPVAINDALGEIAQLKETLAAAVEKLDQLETRLQEANHSV
ncbi:helix-turn-helix domain-containing protein [Neptunicoccus sediminis]|uniref:helix-turn-helix domain-containing protein n=1 Tax=Neptunicoccus sediminis TaxID=1892596 RepID=UPI000845CF0D|nr:helix-turn-helix transcriptional regulator [Neptunicoccus sediminis]